MKESEIIQNTLCAFILLKGAGIHLDLLKQQGKHIDNKDFNEMVKQVLPKVNFFCGNIEKTMLADPRFGKREQNGMYDVIFEMMGLIDDNLRKEIKALI